MRTFGYARTAGYALTTLLLATTFAAANEPTGEWLVKDKVATIRIENCGGSLWGVVAWEQRPGTDENNPDPSKRARPTLGLPIILGMKPSPGGKWEGRIYNTQDGKTYSANISLAAPDVLRVEGCLLGFLCGGEDWTRVKRDPPPRSGTRPAPTPRDASSREVCSRVAELTGQAPNTAQRR